MRRIVIRIEKTHRNKARPWDFELLVDGELARVGSTTHFDVAAERVGKQLLRELEAEHHG